MVQLVCGQDPASVGIKTSEGWNITAFLDHLEVCDRCSSSTESLIEQLNELIGSKES